MDKLSAYGHLVFALDAMYIEGNPLTDDQRDKLMQHFKQSIEYMEDAEALTYYIRNSNTNIKF